MQAAVSVHSCQPPCCDGMVPSAAGRRHLQRAVYTMPYNALSMGMKTPLVTLTLTFKLVRARDQTCLLCEFGANTFSRSQDI